MILLVGCNSKQSNDDSNKKQISEQTASNEKEDKQTKNDEKVQEDEEEPSNVNEPEVEQEMGILQYRPEVGSKKSFTENGEVVFTEEIIAANDEYVQILLQSGANLITQIYHWTKDEITLIYEEYNLENSKEDILNSFQSIDKFETIMHNDSSKLTTWKLINNNVDETVPAGSYSHVFVVQKTTKMVNDEEIITRYYAPKQGLIKEEYKVTGENGYVFTSVLEKIE